MAEGGSTKLDLFLSTQLGEKSISVIPGIETANIDRLLSKGIDKVNIYRVLTFYVWYQH